MESLLSETHRYSDSSHRFRTKFSTELEPLLLRNSSRLGGGAPPEPPALLRSGETSAALRQLLDAQSAICSGVHHWRASAQQLAELMESKRGGPEPDMGVLFNYSLSAASL